ncbi:MULTISPECIES: hypothetical protein [unclassified Microbacterium]|uniref:hypothetical protein n=1 Tax=unclassified Microbacterium TaxID=2609290 RepID=UPI000DE4EA82|nr:MULTISPECIES: hypothetical protein [unclassified Microbacterium]NYF29235.1 hypothetical protein [Microbacterium sp. JAI119]RBO72769.1 hypothetical protein DSP71_09030 [Microbacterium sp. H6]
MSTPPVVPIILNDCELLVEEDNYEAHVSQVQLDPSTNIARWKGLTPTSTHAFPTTPEWALLLAYAQDWATPNSLSSYLFEHVGERKTFKFKPKKAATGTAPTITVVAFIAPGSIGGQVDQVATASVTLGVEGQPTIAAA